MAMTMERELRTTQERSTVVLVSKPVSSCLSSAYMKCEPYVCFLVGTSLSLPDCLLTHCPKACVQSSLLNI
jgi:hypothetical protein